MSVEHGGSEQLREAKSQQGNNSLFRTVPTGLLKWDSDRDTPTPSGMALPLMLALCALVAKRPVGPSPSPSPSPPPSSFELWKKEFGKSYPTEAEEAAAAANYDKATALIDAHNSQPLAFRLGHNRFSDMSPPQVHPGICTSALTAPCTRADARPPPIRAPRSLARRYSRPAASPQTPSLVSRCHAHARPRST